MTMKKHISGLSLEKNAFVDQGDGRIEFPQGMVIIDGAELRNGYKYDMESMDISEYQGQVTADHDDKLEKIIAGVEGVEKQGSRVIVRAINYLVNESALGRLAYDLARNSKVPTNFSVETYGPWPDNSDDTYYKAKLIGLSQVVVGNSRSAVLNAVVKNSLEESEKAGLDIEDLKPLLETKEEIEKELNKMFKTVKNSRDFAVEVRYKNSAEEVVATEIQPGQSIDVAEDQVASVEAQINGATEKIDVEAAVANALKEAQDEFAKQLNDMKKELANAAVTTPKFEKGENGAVTVIAGTSALASQSWRERTQAQLNAFRKGGAYSPEMIEANEFNKAAIDAAGLSVNALDFEAFGNLVIAPEILTEIQGYKNEYSPLLNLVNWEQTSSIKTAWLERDGGIEFESTDFCEDDVEDGNLKPIKDYSTTPREKQLHKYAAVSVVCDAATQFLAVDLLRDAAQAYQEGYDKKRAEAVIWALQQAVDATGQKTPYSTNPAIKGLTSLLPAFGTIAAKTANGTFVFNSTTYAELLQYAIETGVNGPLASLLVTGDIPTLFGRPFVVVPNDLMPNVSGGTVSFDVEGATRTITEGVFYADLTKVLARVAGGLNYNLSSEAAYEQTVASEKVVKSAWQRDETVLRGYFYVLVGMRIQSAVASVTAVTAS